MSTASNIGIQLTLKGAEQVKQGLKTISGSAAEMARQFEASRGAILTTAAAVATATGIMVDRVSTAAAEIERFAMLAGSTPQEFQRMAAGAKSAGMDMEKYASVMKDTQDKIGDFLQTGGGELKDFFEKIAPAVGVTAEQFKNLSGPQALQLFYNSLEKANLSQKETVFWMESIADDATTLVPLLQNNGGAFDALADRAAKYGGVLSDYALAASKDFKGQTDELTLALQGAEQILAVGLMPTLTETARELLATADSAGIADTAATVIRTTLEALVIVASDVAFTFTAVGREIGGMAAQAQAFLSLDFARAGQIGAMMKQDAATARAELEAFQQRLLNAGQTAKDVFNLSGVMKGNKTSTAEYQAALNALIRMKDDGTVSASQFAAAIKGATAANVSAAAAAGRTGKSLSGMGVGADAAKKAADTAKAAADKVASAYGTAWGNAAKLLRDVTAEEQNLNNAEKALADVMAGEHWVKFTAAQQAAAKAIYDRASAAIEARKIEEADAKWASESGDANANVAESAYEAANAAEAQRDAQLQANAAIGLTALEVANLEAARIDDTAAEKQRLAVIMEGIDPAIAADYRRQAQALTELAEAKRDGAVKDAMAETAKEAADEWKRTADKIEDALIDALMDGGKSGAEYIEDLFRTMVLRPVLQVIVSPVAGAVTSALGFSGAAQAGQAGGGLGSLSSLNTAYNAITNGIRSSIADGFGKLVSNDIGQKLGLSYYDGNAYQTTAMGEQFSGVAQGLGSTMTAYGLQKSLSGGYQTGEPGLVDAATAIGGFFDPTGGLIAGAIGGTVNRAFGRKLKDQGLEGTFGGADGFDGNSYEFYKGGWFRSDKTKRKPLDTEVEDALEMQFRTLQVQTAMMAQTLGLSTDSVANFTSKIKISFKGLSEEQISERMAEEFGKVGEAMAQAALGQTEYARTGETAVETLTRLSSSLTTVNGTFDVLGQKLLDTSLAGADMASQLVDLMGGLESFTATTASYLQNFYTEAERLNTATSQLQEQFSALGTTMPTTRDAFRALVEAQDLTTESGRSTYAALMGLSGAFAAVVPSTDDLTETLKDTQSAIADVFGQLRESIADMRADVQSAFATVNGPAAPRNFTDIAGAVAGISTSVPGTSALTTARAALSQANVLSWRSSNAVTDSLLYGAKAVAVATAQALVTEAEDNYIESMKSWVSSASNSVDTLGVLKDETLAYFEAQQQLADGMRASASSLRAAAQEAMRSTLSVDQSLAQRRADFDKAYTLALSTTGSVKAGYADQLTSALPQLAQDMAATASSRAEWAVAVARLNNQATTVAGQLEAQAPTDLQAEANRVLGLIDGKLADLNSAAAQSDLMLTSIISDGNRDQLQALKDIFGELTTLNGEFGKLPTVLSGVAGTGSNNTTVTNTSNPVTQAGTGTDDAQMAAMQAVWSNQSVWNSMDGKERTDYFIKTGVTSETLLKYGVDKASINYMRTLGYQYHTGGYTGPGGKYEAAGVVHRGEVVFSQDDIARLGGVRAVEAIRTGTAPGYADGGVVGSASGPVVVPAPLVPGRVAMAPRPATPDPVQQERDAQARDQAQREAQQQTQDLIAQLRQVNSNLTELKRSVDKSGQSNDQMNNKIFNMADTTVKLLRKFDALGLPVVQAATEAA